MTSLIFNQFIKQLWYINSYVTGATLTSFATDTCGITYKWGDATQ